LRLKGIWGKCGEDEGTEWSGCADGYEMWVRWSLSGKMSSCRSGTSRALERGFSTHPAHRLVYLAHTYSPRSDLFVSLGLIRLAYTCTDQAH
jgi:hypothetical protein